MAVLEYPELLSRKQAAEFLGVDAHTLAVWACTGRYSIPYIKVGRLAKYRREALEAFLRQQTVTSANSAALPNA